MKKHDLALTSGAVLGAGLTAWAVTRFLQQREETIRQLTRGSRLVETHRGTVEVAEVGEGPPVLVVHGGAGGYDQAMLKAQGLKGYHLIAVSRPGYLRTPIETGRTPAEQADALAALLDALDIEKAALVGASAGGLIGIHFALRHPERCWALVLASAVNAPLPVKLTALKPLAQVLAADFLPWMLLNSEGLFLLRPILSQQVGHDPEKRALVEQLIQTIFPVSRRIPGILNDAEQIDNLPPIPLERIAVPTLVIHGDADKVVPFAQGQRSAGVIPGARFLPIAGGSHYAFLTHGERTIPATLEFLDQHAPAKQTFRVSEILQGLIERLRR